MIGGPTATGKTALSVELAKRLNGEILCADSMQIYAGLSIGTARVTPEEAQGVSHHLSGFLPPERAFSVAEYVEAARTCIEEIAARGKTPIVVGGTGLYVESLLRGVRFGAKETSPALRAALERQVEAEGTAALYEELRAADPACAAALHPNNKKRLVRAVELLRLTQRTQAQRAKSSLPQQRPYAEQLYCLSCADRAALYARIDARVDAMLEAGLLEEARVVCCHREEYRTAAQAIGYKELFPFLLGEAALPECVLRLKQATRNYAKRQLTWFHRMEDAVWLEAGAPENVDFIAERWGRERDGNRH